MIGNRCLTNAFDTGSCFGETLQEKPMLELLVILEVLMLRTGMKIIGSVGSGNISKIHHIIQVLVLMMLCFICKMKIIAVLIVIMMV